LLTGCGMTIFRTISQLINDTVNDVWPAPFLSHQEGKHHAHPQNLQPGRQDI
jgi:hypothetical protein